MTTRPDSNAPRTGLTSADPLVALASLPPLAPPPHVDRRTHRSARARVGGELAAYARVRGLASYALVAALCVLYLTSVLSRAAQLYQ